MNGVQVKNLDFLRKITIPDHPEFGARLAEAFQSLALAQSNVALQVNANPNGPVGAPPPVNAIHVSAGGGVAHISITDNNEVYRGISYHVHYSTDPNFSNPVTVHLGPSRDIRIPVGTQKLYYRAISDYPTSPASSPVYFGGAAPVGIAATGSEQPSIPVGNGSGTGTPRQISGYGPIPFRSSTGAPPEKS